MVPGIKRFGIFACLKAGLQRDKLQIQQQINLHRYRLKLHLVIQPLKLLFAPIHLTIVLAIDSAIPDISTTLPKIAPAKHKKVIFNKVHHFGHKTPE